MRNPSRTLRRARGQAAAEFTLIVALVAAALCLPWGGNPAPASRLLEAFTSALRSFEYWISCC
jgi:hypothetical protein